MEPISNLHKNSIHIIKPESVPLGIKNLTHGILGLAIKDIEKKNEYLDDAIKWVFSNDTNYIFSFLNICQIFDLNPEYVRKAIKSKIPNNYQILFAALLPFKKLTIGYGNCQN